MIGAKPAPSPEHVIPAKLVPDPDRGAGIQAGWGGGNLAGAPPRRPWIPAFAGMTEGPGITAGAEDDGGGLREPNPSKE